MFSSVAKHVMGANGPNSVKMKRQQAVRACTHCKRLHAKVRHSQACVVKILVLQRKAVQKM